MKKISLLVFLMCSLASCMGPLETVANNAGQDKESPELQTSVAKWAGLMYNLRVDAAEAAMKYLSSDDGAMSRSLGLRPNLLEVLNKLPPNFSSLERPLSLAGSRDVATAKTITLNEEWTALVNQFNEAVAEIIPDPALALTLPHVKIVDGNIVYEGDLSVPLDSAHGIFLVECLNAQARGEDPNLVMARLQNDLKPLLDQISSTSQENRSLTTEEYKQYRYKYPGGKVTYWMPEVSDHHKRLVRAAMAEWSVKTGKITFYEQPYTTESYWARFWGQFQILEIKDKSLGVNGLTSYDRDDVDMKVNQTDDEYAWTIRHELGHVLGLSHEFQRADRDNYVYSEGFKYFGGQPIGGPDWAKIPEFQGGYIYTPLWGWFPYWTWIDNKDRVSTMTGSYDYHSIMNYPSPQDRTSDWNNIWSYKSFLEEYDAYSKKTYVGSRVIPIEFNQNWVGRIYIPFDALFITPRDVSGVRLNY